LKKTEKTAELKPEILPEAVKDKVQSLSKEQVKPIKQPPVTIQPAVAQPTLPPLYSKVEKILEEDLGEVYFKMSPDKQQAFKVKGEETTLKISRLLQNARIKVRQIFKLIISWLGIIPGVNKHYLEQEAKIKTDKLLIARDQELRK